MATKEVKKTCTHCGGTGKIAGSAHQCGRCWGDGYVKETVHVSNNRGGGSGSGCMITILLIISSVITTFSYI